jgi:leader peptidase (prepilin peptidase)/N-methyltransferase
MPDASWVVALTAGVFGLVIGSFLNVVIYRLPKMLERQWAIQCAELKGDEAAPQPAFNLAVPRSSCPRCGHLIRWYENIPLVSYLLLRGKCSGCHQAISPRYPLVELATGLLFVWCAWHWGWTASALAWCYFSATLLALALIDWDTTLLPDDLVLPLLWAGLITSALGWIPVRLSDALWGAVAGYLVLWAIYWAFKLLTGKEGMGYGDFKLLAALGAWFGWQGLIPILLMASVIGALIGIVMKVTHSLRDGGAMPFGPFLALGGAAGMVAGPAAILRVIGL